MYMKVLFSLVLCVTSTPWAQAQVYKCSSPEGKVAYQQTPCPSESIQERPQIQKAPTLTEQEKFNAAAYSAGMTPEQARQLLSGQTQSVAQHVEPPSNFSQSNPQEERRRVRDCNQRYDELARQAKDTFRSAKAQGNLRRHLEQIENGRTSCLYGSAASGQVQNQPPPYQPPPLRNVGQCQGQCASEQGICIAQCSGDGQCIGRCAASHGRCVAACSY